MRLTLRTLLAYMDDILDPADQEALGRKIESSPFATELIHRSRDAVRRLRLSSPDPMAGADDDIHGGDSNLDANTASEYLDNTLSPEAVADFERSCLEAGANADMLLAEAASCHHVLTMVLGEPAEVDADLRQRMYALSQSPAAAPQQLRVEPAHQAPKQPPIAAAAAAPPATAARAPRVDPDETGVPDYILAAARERRRGRRMAAAVVGAVIFGGAATWFFMTGNEVIVPDNVAELGDVDELTESPTVDESAGPTTSASTGEDAAIQPGGEDSEAPAFTPDTAAAASTAPGATEAPTLSAPALETEMPSVTLPPEVATPEAGSVEAGTAEAAAAAGEPGTNVAVATLPELDAQQTAGTDTAADAAPMVEGATAPVEDAPVAEAPASDATGATASATPPLTPSPTGGSAIPAEPTDGPLTGGAAAAADAAVAATVGEAPMTEADATAAAQSPPAVDAAAAQPKPIGAYLGNNDLLLRLDEESGTWVRLSPRTALVGGEQLLALPTFRTHVVLSDVNAYLTGGAQINLIPIGQAGGQPAEFALHIPYGQVVLNSGLNGNRVELAMVDQNRVVQLGPSSSLAVEVRRVFEPGGDDKREPAPAEVTWYLTSGSLKWGDTGSAEAPATWTTIAGEDSVPVAIDELPEWVDHEPIGANELRARNRIATALIPGESVHIHLLEMSDPASGGRRSEDRALAARSGAYVGLYDALVSALADVNQRSSWREQIEALRQAIARDPSAVEGIREAFAMQRGQEAADDLMEMLLGFDRAAVGTTREEVQQGALMRLFRWMDDDDLTHRILASHNVNEILGRRDLEGYKPEHTTAQRKRSLARMWERLERGELTPAEERPSS